MTDHTLLERILLVLSQSSAWAGIGRFIERRYPANAANC